MRPGPRLYNVFPLLAGQLDRWDEHLDRAASLGFDWVFLNPFHYPGFSGSLYAVKDYYRLHDVLQGNSSSSPDRLLADLAAKASSRGLRLAMDLVINHTSKDSILASEHPEFFAREANGELKSPSAIDPADARKVTVWGDLAEIDYTPREELKALISTWNELLSHFIALGFSGFRCDAAYKVPSPVWSQLITHARSFGTVTFFAETLGCRLPEAKQLAGAGFDFFFNSSKWWDFEAPWLLEQYEQFRHLAPSIAFPESHDTPRLCAELETKGVRERWQVEASYRLRYLFAAFFSSGLMMPMGFEHGARNRLDVVTTRPHHAEAPMLDLGGFISAVNRIKAQVPALNEEGPQKALSSPRSNITALLRTSHDGRSKCLALINPSPDQTRFLEVDPFLPLAGHGFEPVCDTTPGAVEGAWAAGQQIRLSPLSMRLLRADA